MPLGLWGYAPGCYWHTLIRETHKDKRLFCFMSWAKQMIAISSFDTGLLYTHVKLQCLNPRTFCHGRAKCTPFQLVLDIHKDWLTTDTWLSLIFFITHVTSDFWVKVEISSRTSICTRLQHGPNVQMECCRGFNLHNNNYGCEESSKHCTRCIMHKVVALFIFLTWSAVLKPHVCGNKFDHTPNNNNLVLWCHSKSSKEQWYEYSHIQLCVCRTVPKAVYYSF